MAHRDAGILVLNAGSSSIKLALFDREGDEPIIEREVDLAGGSDYRSALKRLLETINPEHVGAVGHRVVHGGTRYRSAVLVDDDVKRNIAELSALAPLHNPPALAVIDAAEATFPDVPQVAVFDTAFHASLSPARFLYPVPYHWYEAWGIRRFGFHGISHAYCARRAAEMLGKPAGDLRLVNCHLGAGCSLAAIAAGKSVATTMGFTPLDGVPMATRPGTLDPGILMYLLAGERLTLDDLDQALRKDSGLKGVSGISGDMREIAAARANGNERAALAFDLFTDHIRMSIAGMVAAMDGVDAIIFTAGIGEHSAEVREAVAAPLGWMGVVLDEARNAEARPDQDIAQPDSPVRVLLIHTREDLLIAQEVRQVLQSAIAGR